MATEVFNSDAALMLFAGDGRGMLAPYLTSPLVGPFRAWRDDLDCRTWVPTCNIEAGVRTADDVAMIGKVSSVGHELAPLGSYSFDLNNMACAKWAFVLESPGMPELDDHFDEAFHILRDVQGAASVSGINRNLLAEDVEQRGIRFARPIFITKVGSLIQCSVVSDSLPYRETRQWVAQLLSRH